MTNQLKGPEFIEIRKFIQNKSLLEFHLLNNDVLSGQIIWVDENAFHLKLTDGQELTLLKHSIVFYKEV